MRSALKAGQRNMILDLEAHSRTDTAIKALLALGYEQVEDKIAWQSCHKAGPASFTLVSSHEAAARLLTPYLFPATAPGFTLYLHVGPVPAWDFAHTSDRHLERLHVSEDGLLTAQYDVGTRCWSIWEEESQRGLLWIHSLEDLPAWHQTAPFRNLIHWALAHTSAVLLHAGTVDNLLLAGKGGSGKSTTVAACALAGMGTCGDDMIAVEDLHAYPVFNSVKLDASQAQRLGFGNGLQVSEKAAYRYTDLGMRVPLLAEITAIIIPIVSNADRCSVEPVSAAVALLALGPSTAFLLRGHEQQSLEKIKALVRAVPCYELKLSHDLKDVTDTLSLLKDSV